MTMPFRVLVVDDEPAQLELVAGFLAKRGFEAIARIRNLRQRRLDL